MPDPEPLLIVDVQKGFLNDYTCHIPERIVRLVETRRCKPLLFTRFVNTPSSYYRRLLDWDACSGPPETDLAPEMQRLAEGAHVFDKPGIAGIPPALEAHLREAHLPRLLVVGIDTDMCVLKCAMDLFDLGIEPIVLADCCASTAGLQAHLAGLAILGRNIGPRQLQLTGLHGGFLGAP
jgi:nicotinamidase-related amidase